MAPAEGGVPRRVTSASPPGTTSTSDCIARRSASTRWRCGQTSTALGQETLASGARSVAYGFNTVASGPNSLAGGNFSNATGLNSVAFGDASQAGGDNAIAVGLGAKALSARSQAFGTSTQATGVSSMAIGSATQAIGTAFLAAGTNAIARAAASMVFNNAESLPNAIGSFVWGDTSTATRVQSDMSNQFIVRASGGFRFATNSSQSTGVLLLLNASQFSQLSDVSTKHRFRDLDGEALLGKVAGLPIQEWSYLAQDSAVRHVGPTAQDFFSAFGLGESERHIGTLDADGVALAAVKALELRMRGMRDRENALADDQRALRARNEALARENARLRTRLERLECLLELR